jgi:hypothetical protein
MDKNTEIENKTSDTVDSPDKSRRKLTQAVLAAPIMGSLASRPALGGGFAGTCNISVLQSGNASMPVDYESCGGCSPGFWFTAALNNHSCHLPSGINGSTTFGQVFGLYPQNKPNCSDTDKILDALIEHPFLGFNARNKSAISGLCPTIFGHICRNKADDLFMFCRAAACAWLNANTIGVAFPSLIAGGSLHSVSEIEYMVGSVFGGMPLSAPSYQAQLHMDWDNSEESTCSMLGSCI